MFIVLDGLDGSGKCTQTKLVSEALISMGKKVLMLDYPRYGENSAYFVEKYLNGAYGELNAKAASIFYALDRFEDSFNFKERQQEYDYIISNRYVSASMIHQAGKIQGKEKRKKFFKWLYKLEYKIFRIPKPDLVLFLDVPPKISQELVEKKESRDYITDGKTKDLHEADINHLENAYKVAHEILETFPDWKAIKCTKDEKMLPIKTITQKILSHILGKNMNQVVQDKMQREIMAVQNAFLFADIKRETKVYTREEIDFESIIEKNYEFLTRGPLETNFDYKQPIPYGIVINNENKIFVYKRGGTGSNAGESRLHNKIAIGVGGHIEREDEASSHLLRDALVREVEEEIGIKESDISEIFPIGYINYEENEVNQVHLGIGYIIKISGGDISMTDGELAKGEFKSLDELKEMIASGDFDIEFWTQMLVPFAEKYI